MWNVFEEVRRDFERCRWGQAELVDSIPGIKQVPVHFVVVTPHAGRV